MHIFVTGATGWVGSHVVDQLLGAGHRVTGLSRTAQKAGALAARGAEVVQGTLDDHALLAEQARRADAVAHLAFNHDDFSRFAEHGAQEERAIAALGDGLEGSGKPLLVTSGVALLAPGCVSSEADGPDAASAVPRRPDQAAEAVAARGVAVGVVRLSPSVHGVGEAHGFVPMLIDIARDKGVSAYIGEGQNHWPAVHVTDAARLYRLALEQGVPERTYHAVAEGGVPFRRIAEAIGARLGLPVEAREPGHFGWFAHFAGLDARSSSDRTRAALGWAPTGPELLADIADPEYYAGR